MKAKHPVKHRRKKRTTLSAAPKKRRSHKKHGFLSELTNPTVAKNSAKATLLAAAGGLGATIVSKNVLPEKWGKTGKIGSALVGGFLLNTFGMGAIGNGFTAGMMALAFQNGLLADDANFADENIMSDQPLYLDEAGTPLVLEEDGQGGEFFREMTEAESLQMGY